MSAGSAVALWLLVGLVVVTVAAVVIDKIEAMKPRSWFWPLIFLLGPVVLAVAVIAAIGLALVVGAGL